MATIKTYPRIPAQVGDVQVNHCKTPGCVNFGKPAAQNASRTHTRDDGYTIIGAKRQARILSCRYCKRASMMRSNLSITQEIDRLDTVGRRLKRASCPEPSCSSYESAVLTFPGQYFSHGKTKAGEPRFRCKSCGSTFTAGATTRVQRRPELDTPILKLLVNKMPMRRICETLGVNASTLYNKIRYLAAVCSEFMAEAESTISSGGLPLRRAYVSVDRQDYLLNWGSQLDRRNTQLGAVGAVENVSGYVFAMQLNFDPECDPQDVEADAIARGDYDVPPVHRHYARLWLRRDYEFSTADNNSETHDQANDFHQPSELKAPRSGMQVKMETLYFGVFFHLKKLLQHAEKTRFFIDRDPGLDSACLSAFVDAIKARRADVFLIKTNKTASMQAKKTLMSQSSRDLERFIESHAVPRGQSPQHHFVLSRLQAFRASCNSNAWFAYPISDMADAGKEVKFLTDFADFDSEHLARLYMRASLRGVDKFFMQVRRRLSVMERPIHSPNNSNRSWYGYAAYSPAVVQHLLIILRAYTNFCLVGEDDKTPAMRLGLTSQPLALEALVGSSRGRSAGVI